MQPLSLSTVTGKWWLIDITHRDRYWPILRFGTEEYCGTLTNHWTGFNLVLMSFHVNSLGCDSAKRVFPSNYPAYFKVTLPTFREHVYLCLMRFTVFLSMLDPAAKDTKRRAGARHTHELRSFGVYMCLFACMWMPLLWGSAGEFLFVRWLLLQTSFVLKQPAQAWGVTLLQFKEGPVSRIAGLRMRTGGFPTCNSFSLCPVSSLNYSLCDFLLWHVKQKKFFKKTPERLKSSELLIK